MSDHAHRIMMRQLNADDNMIQADEDYSKQQILAEHAHQQEQAMREEFPQGQYPEGIDPVYEQFIDNHPEAIHASRWSQDDGDLMAYRSEDVI